MRGAGESIDLLFLIHGHRRHFVKGPPVGQLTPAFDDFVAKFSTANGNSHTDLHMLSWFQVVRAYGHTPYLIDYDSCSYTCRHASNPPLMLQTFLKPFSIK